MFSLSPIYSACKSSNHKLSKIKQIKKSVLTQIYRKHRRELHCRKHRPASFSTEQQLQDPREHHNKQRHLLMNTTSSPTASMDSELSRQTAARSSSPVWFMSSLPDYTVVTQSGLIILDASNAFFVCFVVLLLLHELTHSLRGRSHWDKIININSLNQRSRL